MNQEARQAATRNPWEMIDGRPQRRLAPNLYMVVQPGLDGVMGDEKPGLGFDVGGLVNTIGGVATTIAGQTFGYLTANEQLAMERQAQAAQLQAAADARAMAQIAQQQAHDEQMASIAAQTEALKAQATTAGATAVSPMIAQAAAMPPWAWAAIGVGGLAVVGGIILAIRRR